jgi:PKD repeat protein
MTNNKRFTQATLISGLLFILFLTALPLSATIYYVNPTIGSDSYNGQSTSTPWRTVNKVNNSMAFFKPGDSILFMGGKTFSDSHLFITCQGTSGNPITFGSYGTGRPKLSSRGIQCGNGSGYITVDNFEVANPPGDGIAFYKDSGWQYEIKITNCYVYGAGNVGIILLSVDGYLVQNCIVHDSYNGNIFAYGSRYPIKNGEIRGCQSYDAIQNDGIGIHVGDYGEACGPNHRIISCKVHGNAEEGIDINSGTYVTILGCEAYGDKYAGIMIEGDHCTVRRSKIHNGHVGIHIGASDTTLESNLIYSNGEDQILIEPYRDISGVNLYHNTIVAGPNSQRIILNISPRARGIKAINNIFTSTQYSLPNTYVRFMDGATPSSSGSSFDYNVYWRRDNNSSARWYVQGNISFATWQSKYGQDLHGLWADPRFNSLSGSDFHLQDTSPCRDAGKNIGVLRDYEGTSIPWGPAPDIGAYEYNSGIPPPPPPPGTLQANAAASPVSGEVPLTVQFQGFASGGSPPYSYSWSSSDGATSTLQNPSHTFESTGTFTVTLTVTDSQNQSDSDSLSIRVFEQSDSPLIASLSASQTSGQAPLSVKFSASATGGTAPYSYSWNFGNGTSSGQQNITHTYTASGTFVVTLTVTDSHNSKAVKTTTIKVNEANLLADFACVPDSLYFGALSSGDKTPAQHLNILDTTLGLLNWSTTTNREWLSCSPSSGTGSGKITVTVDPTGLRAGYYQGSIIIFASNARVSPRYVTVALNVHDQDATPIGSVDSPQDGTVVSGNFPISGWALDNIHVARVTIKRSAHPDDIAEKIGPDGLVELGDVFFCEDARQDIAKTYPEYPMNISAGWGYILQTYKWPNKGNGLFTIHAIAIDSSGQAADLGSRTIVGNNSGRTHPFGSVETPGSGEQISGEEFTSTGWILAPLPKTIPIDGHTIWIWMDGMRIGNPAYNQYREDIAFLFPEYANSQGAGGYFSFCPNQFRSGIHTLFWSATDDAGESGAIDSRYFSIHNPNFAASQLAYLELKNIYEKDTEGRMKCEVEEVRMGYTLETKPDIQSDEQGKTEIQVEEMEPVEIRFKTNTEGPLTFFGWGEEEWETLPLGTTLKREEGIFYWIPPPGFLGAFVFHFAYTDGTTISQPIEVRVQVTPKASEDGKKKQREINR